MSGIDIDRVSIAIHGVTRALAEEAAADLKSAVAQRIGALTLGETTLASLDLSQVTLSVDAPARSDASTLRALIADTIANEVLAAHREAAAPVHEQGEAH